jgi:hypothetical protein
MANVQNVIYGPAKTFQVDGVDLGFTAGGVELNHEVTSKDIEADQVVGRVKTMKTKDGYTIKTSLLESTLANLQIVWGLTAAPATDGSGNNVLYVGVERTFKNHSLYFVGQGPNGFERQITVHIAQSVAASKLDLKKDAEEMYAVQFNLLPDFTQPPGQEYMKILDSASAVY